MLFPRYQYALVDGHLEKIGNFTIEPPALFRGRGLHPKTGTHKKRVMPEQVTINIGEDKVRKRKRRRNERIEEKT